MNNRQLACEIANHLFTNGSGGHAKRLVLEMPNLTDGGGWAESVVSDLIEDHLNAQQSVQADAALRCASDLHQFPGDATECPFCGASLRP